MRTPVLFLITLAACGGASTADPVGAEGGPDAGAKSTAPDARTSPTSAPDARVVVVPDAAATGGADPARHFVTSSLTLGKTVPEANGLGFDLDGNGTIDNALGKTLAALAGTLDVAGYADTALADGTFVILHSLRASGATDATAEWQVYVGDPKAMPDLTSGHGAFTVAARSPPGAIVTGGLAGGQFTGGPDPISVTIALVEGLPPITLHLLAAHLVADVTTSGCSNGRVGGAVPLTDVHDNIIPAVAAALDARIGADGDCRTNDKDCSLSSELILGLFDANGDRTITADEVADNLLVKATLQPDVDLLDADGNPGQDGVKDSLSLALGFTCAGAVFDAPNE